MARSKGLTKTQKTIIESDELLYNMKSRYFELLEREDYGKTHVISKTLDKLQGAIAKRIQEIISDNQ